VGIERHARLVEGDIARVCDTSHGHKQIAARDLLLAGRRPPAVVRTVTVISSPDRP
jgi:hypothetical protein